MKVCFPVVLLRLALCGVGPVLILVGMVLVGLVEVTASLNLAGGALQERASRGGIVWSLVLGVVFALSFCPVSAGLFFGGLVPLSAANGSRLLLPSLFGAGTAVPVIGFAFLMAFATQHLGRAFNRLTQVEYWVRMVTGTVFILAGIYHCVTHIYGVSLLVW